MQLEQTGMPGLLLLKPVVHKDERGFFLESFRQDLMESFGIPGPFVQDNHAASYQKGVVRGLHYQRPPAAQSKLVWVTQGAVFDAVVDLRRGSPTYGQNYSVILSSQNFLRFYVPAGFAHGYMTLETTTEVHYKVDAYYNPEFEAGLAWDDPLLGVKWPAIEPVLSAKDRKQPGFKGFKSPFIYTP